MPDDSTPPPDLSANEQHFILTVTASGSVHDKDGNLISGDVGGVTEILVTADEARQLMEGQG